jgi:hypothetical protein
MNEKDDILWAAVSYHNAFDGVYARLPHSLTHTSNDYSSVAKKALA